MCNRLIHEGVRSFLLNVKMLKPLFYMFINIHTSLNLMVLPLTLMPLRRLKNWDIKSVFPSLMLLRRQKDWDMKSFPS